MPLPSRPERQRGQHDAQRTTSAGEATLSPSLSYGARDAIRWVPECPSSPAVPVEQPVEQPRVPSASSIRARACYSIQRKGVIRTMTDTVDGVGVWAHDRVCRLACGIGSPTRPRNDVACLQRPESLLQLGAIPAAVAPAQNRAAWRRQDNQKAGKGRGKAKTQNTQAETDNAAV